MGTLLIGLAEGIAPPTVSRAGSPVYAAVPVPGHADYLVGRDHESHVSLLIASGDEPGRRQPPIRLRDLAVQFSLRCRVMQATGPDGEGVFTVISCRSVDQSTGTYFLSICEALLLALGEHPMQSDVSKAVHRLAAIMQELQKPASRSVLGIWGELYVLSCSEDVAVAVEAWRVRDEATYDFARGAARLEVKASGTRERAHEFSFEQCGPPAGLTVAVASLLTERTPGGVTIQSLLNQIETRLGAQSDHVLKLHEVVAATLGGSLLDSLDVAFDAISAGASLRFYDVRELPAVGPPLPSGVSAVRFRSDLSAAHARSPRFFSDQESAFSGLLPK